VTEDSAERIRETAGAIYRAESRRVFATLIRLLGDFDLAEEALHDAFRAALEQWPRSGVPANPRAWLVSAGRYKAIDGIRRNTRFDALDDFAEEVENVADPSAAPGEEDVIEDDRLRLIFTCCHPALAPEAQIALTLREVCGLATEEIAQAFLSPAPTLAQRIVRAKAKIRDARIPYQVPEANELGERLASVLRVIYLVFNEGYSPSAGQSLTRIDLSAEAIRLGRLLADLLPDAVPRVAVQGMPMFAGALVLVLGALVAGNGYSWGTVKTVALQGPGRLTSYAGTLVALALVVVGLVVALFASDVAASLVVAAAEGRPVVAPEPSLRRPAAPCPGPCWRAGSSTDVPPRKVPVVPRLTAKPGSGRAPVPRWPTPSCCPRCCTKRGAGLPR